MNTVLHDPVLIQPSAVPARPARVVLPPGRRARRLLTILVSFPIAGFTGALATDIAYAFTANIMWADFSAWLLAVGLLLGVLATITGGLTLIGSPRPRRLGVLVFGVLTVLALGLLDNLVHSRDAWTSVVPEGLALSALLVIIMLATVWAGMSHPDGAVA